MSLKIDRLKCRVRLESGGAKKDDRAKPAAPSLDFALPEPVAPKPRIDEASDDAHGDVADAGASLAKVDPKKVADRVYELMQRETRDALDRGGARRR